MASLTLKHVDRAFPNGYEAVKDLNFQIEDGEFVILTGAHPGVEKVLLCA